MTSALKPASEPSRMRSVGTGAAPGAPSNDRVIIVPLLDWQEGSVCGLFAPQGTALATPDSHSISQESHKDKKPGCNRIGDWAYSARRRTYKCSETERGCSSGVEHNLAKVRVVGSNPIARSNFQGVASLGAKGPSGPFLLFCHHVFRHRHCLELSVIQLSCLVGLRAHYSAYAAR